MDTQIYTKEAQNVKASMVKLALALSKLRLFDDSLTLTQFTTKAQLLAAESVFDGYTPGGYVLTAWLGPLNDSGGGVVITSPLVHLAYGPAEDPVVTGLVGGWWIEDAAGAVRIAGTYDPPRVMTQVGDGWDFVAQLVEGRVVNLS